MKRDGTSAASSRRIRMANQVALLTSSDTDYREAAVLNVKRFEGDILDSI
jgi:hypothetical protein